MGFSLDHSFVVKTTPDRVWAFLTDPYRVAPALPGASITDKIDDTTYQGAIALKVGPVSARYKGTVKFAALDRAGQTAEIVAKGQDTSGRGGADLKMRSKLVERAPGETEVSMTSEVNVTGMLAQFGRGIIQDVSNQMFQRFTEAVRAELEKPAEPAALVAEGGARAPDAAEPEAAPPVEPAAEAPPAAAPPAAAEAPRPSPPVEAAPIDALALGGTVATGVAKRMLARPAFWVALGVLFLLVWWLSRSTP